MEVPNSNLSSSMCTQRKITVLIAVCVHQALDPHFFCFFVVLSTKWFCHGMYILIILKRLSTKGPECLILLRKCKQIVILDFLRLMSSSASLLGACTDLLFTICSNCSYSGDGLLYLACLCFGPCS